MDTNLQKYMVFLKTAECGSFTRAAELLSYSQSAVSRMIGDLEKEWRVTLLVRGRAGVRLTSDGMKLLPYARRVCEEYQRLQAQVDELNGLQTGLLRIGTFSSVAAHWLPGVIKAFQRDYPNIEYELLLGDYTEIETWVIEGRVDCGFLRLPAHPDLETILLGRDRLLAVLPEGHPLARYERVPAARLCQESFLLLEKGGKADVSEIFEEHGLAPKVRFTTWDDYAIMSMVESGLGVSVLPELILRRVPYRIVVRELDVPAGRDIALALRGKKSASLAVRRFLEYLSYREP
ncbi:Transcriptional regulator [uncultured Eubacteriales bacterium]|uniref:Transcriptional regulator n=1 Tax=uncultured Eubacteriales bacterium TaxID=172733 RepID=A0A212KEU9_9FIRM|nr:Transcriptional regulator [uncultured Eubacteriales bacterium]